MTAPALDRETLRRAVAAALDEDLGTLGDITTKAAVPAGRRARATIVARAPMTVAGLDAAREVFSQIDPSVVFTPEVSEGQTVEAGRVVATAHGSASSLLAGERSALNFLQRMSGIATATRAAVAEVEGTGVTILDTRKTAPGLRALDKHAVAAGGGTNHRQALFDAAMIKDTHLAVVESLATAVRDCLAAGIPASSITAEVRTEAELQSAIAAGAGRALLDNMTLESMRSCVRAAQGKIVLEASGGIGPSRLRAVAETGVDCISLGYLTHSVQAADLAMDLTAIP